jgi:hypothetical protein
MQNFTEEHFDQLSFHDNLLRGISIRAQFPDQADLTLDIDYITEWVKCGSSYEWMIAAADLTFHGVTGLKLSIDTQDEGYQVVSCGDWIIDLSRNPIVPQLVHFDRQYWRWEFGFVMATALSFGAYGFTLQLRQEPVRHNEQSLPLEIRR